MNKTWIILFVSLLLFSCDNEESSKEESVSNYYQISGEAQGTTYGIIFQSDKLEPTKVKASVDSLLDAYDMENSIYKEGSLISLLNKSSDTAFNLGIVEFNTHFKTCFNVSKELYHLSNAAFNPAVYPLVNYWGFHKSDFNYQPDSVAIADLLKLIDFSNEIYRLEDNLIIRKNTNSKIDFNALAQGHSVDVVGDYLELIGVENYMVEIGGEITCKGKNPDHSQWRVGIDKPIDDSNPGENGFEFIAAVSDMSLATSGNYRKYYEIDGQKYSHTIDPTTGYPAMQNLLSVTVITEECIYADAFATTFMVMGLDQSLSFIAEHPELNLNVYFVYDNEGQIATQMTHGFESFILN